MSRYPAWLVSYFYQNYLLEGAFIKYINLVTALISWRGRIQKNIKLKLGVSDKHKPGTVKWEC